MASLINQDTCENAYLEVCNYLIVQPNFEAHNIIITISDPCDFSRLNYSLQHRNPVKINNNFDNLRNVINTIFPFQLATHFSGNRNGLYTKYLRIYSKSRKRKWGTYFQRFVSFTKHSTTGINQLENIINSLNGGSPQRYYNIMHTTSVNIESNVRPLGGACLQYVQINKRGADIIDLIAVYRNHDYFNKALGNFYGLAYLLEFIASNTNYNSGSLIIHSIHAFSSQGKNRLRNLII